MYSFKYCLACVNYCECFTCIEKIFGLNSYNVTITKIIYISQLLTSLDIAGILGISVQRTEKSLTRVKVKPMLKYTQSICKKSKRSTLHGPKTVKLDTTIFRVATSADLSIKFVDNSRFTSSYFIHFISLISPYYQLVAVDKYRPTYWVFTIPVCVYNYYVTNDFNKLLFLYKLKLKY